jgi:hypothetical protein
MIIPIPIHQEDEIVPQIKTEVNHARVLEFLNIKPWRCPSCNLTNFGGNLACANYQCKIPRPVDFVEERR